MKFYTDNHIVLHDERRSLYSILKCLQFKNNFCLRQSTAAPFYENHALNKIKMPLL